MADSGVRADDSPNNVPLEAVLDEIIEQHRAGKDPCLTDFEHQYPQHAAGLREIFSTLLMAERLGGGSRPGAESSRDSARGKPDEFPSQIGDFKLQQELGRGGMGVVFAARQVSLNRTVAIKLLSSHLASDLRFAERFAREARSAARLQHPNIVPVISNGCEQGVSYYTMQLIDGRNLAEVLAGVRQLLAGAESRIQGDELDYPRRLLHGSSRKGASTPASPEKGTVTGRHTTRLTNTARLQTEVTGPDGNAPDLDEEITDNVNFRLSESGKRIGRRPYFRNIAGLARDVAWALEYAHQQGTVHRDIKPSNLILDTNGRIWITDFGLARLDSEQPMTLAGDMLGTLRYIAPEQLQGESSPACDIYGVGVTLYELATLQPAWNGPNHARIMEQVLSGTLIRPRSIDSSIPADLETIILTAMARDPGNRYRSARELGDDLDRFCNDQPIKARKPSAVELLIRWARRNRLTAAAVAGAIFLAAFVVPGLSIGYSLQLRNEITRSREAEQKTSEANAAARKSLVESLTQQARAIRETRSITAREECLNLLRSASSAVSELETAQDEIARMKNRIRDEAVAALALPAFPEAFRIPFGPELRESSDILFIAKGMCVQRRVLQGSHVTELLNPEVPGPPMLRLDRWPDRAVINKQRSHLLISSSKSEETAILELWQIDGAERKWSAEVAQFQGSFSPGGRHVIALDESGSLLRHDIETGETVRRRNVASGPALDMPRIFCDPAARTIAIVENGKIEIRTIADHRLLKSIPHLREGTHFDNACWSPQGNWFAVKSTEGLITLYDPLDWEPLRVLPADNTQGTQLSASGDGRYLQSSGWTKRIELFDVVSGEKLAAVSAEVDSLMADLSDGLVGPVTDSRRAQVLKLVPGQVYRTYGSTPDSWLRARTIRLSPDGDVAAIHVWPDKLALLDLKTGEHQIVSHQIISLAFDAHGDFWGFTGDELFKWPRIPDDRRIRFGDPQLIGSIEATWFDIDASGQTIAWNRNEGVVIADISRLDAPQVRVEWADVRRTVVSPDGRWVVGAGHNTNGCRVFDTRSQDSWDIAPEFKWCLPAFSSDSTLLAVTVPGQSLRLYRSGHWDRPVLQWNPSIGVPAFSPDGRMLAASFDVDAISLIRLDDPSVICRLTHPGELTLNSMKFTGDSCRILFTAEESNCVHEWNLSALRQELESLGMEAEFLPRGDRLQTHHSPPDENGARGIEFASGSLLQGLEAHFRRPIRVPAIIRPAIESSWKVLRSVGGQLPWEGSR